MIPTIEDIVADLLAGTMTKEQAVHWLYQHMEQDGLRDQFAARAMHAFLVGDGTTNFSQRARESYEMADAMLQERSK